MANEDNKFEDYKDFEDATLDQIELDKDLSSCSEDAIEAALKNIASQMTGSSEYSKAEISTFDDNLNHEQENNDAASQNEEEEKITEEQQVSKEEEEVGNAEELLKKEDTELDSDIEDEATEDVSDNTEEEKFNLDDWEELNNSNDVVKKYIIYISKEFIPIVDKLTPDERSAYINDAIQIKVDALDEKVQKNKKRAFLIHLAIAIAVFVFSTPFILYITNKAFMATFDNYKYSQDNFERLYQSRFYKDKVYMRSVQYNKQYAKNLKNAKKSKNNQK